MLCSSTAANVPNGKKVVLLSFDEIKKLRHDLGKPNAKQTADKLGFVSVGHDPNNWMPVLQQFEKAVVGRPLPTAARTPPKRLKSRLHAHQVYGLAWMLWREYQPPHGGIFADEMGLGKSLSMIALVLKSMEFARDPSKDSHTICLNGTLIVCPAALVSHWKQEIVKHSFPDSVKVIVLQGADKKDLSSERLAKAHFVIISYETLRSFVVSNKPSMKENIPQSSVSNEFFKLKWMRVILDEAHQIKNPQTSTARAVFNLRAFNRWAVSGTPIHNDRNDFYSLIKFLRVPKLDEFSIWKDFVKYDLENGCKYFRVLTNYLLLRRTKLDKGPDANYLIVLPVKTEITHRIKLSERQRSVYKSLYESFKKSVVRNLDPKSSCKGTNTLVYLLRLQQCCNHTALLGKEFDSDQSFSEGDPAINELSMILENLSLDADCDKSTKVDAILKELRKVLAIRDEKWPTKCVIVSQWVSMLDLIGKQLDRLRIPHAQITGNVTMDTRSKTIDSFNNDSRGFRVLLLSIKAGGVGLNLIGGNQLFLVDLHWNPQIEEQALSRVHRLGQTRPVVIHKFICDDTIEERIRCLQKSKMRVANSVLDGVPCNVQSSKLTADDFKMLFGMQ